MSRRSCLQHFIIFLVHTSSLAIVVIFILKALYFEGVDSPGRENFKNAPHSSSFDRIGGTPLHGMTDFDRVNPLFRSSNKLYTIILLAV